MRRSVFLFLVSSFVVVQSVAIRAQEFQGTSVRLEGPVQISDTRREELTDQIAAASSLVGLGRDGVEDPRDLIAAARSDYARVVEALYALGHYSAVVRIRLDGREAALIDPFETPRPITQAEIVVEPGRPFRFGRTDIAPLAPGTELPEDFAPNRTARSTRIQQAAAAAVDQWRQTGYAKADIASQSITANHPSAVLDVNIDVAPGRQVAFGNVTVTGESAVRPTRVRAIAGLPPRGTLYMPEPVQKAAERLRRTGTFQSVRVIEADRINPDGTMDIEIAVLDRRPRRIGGGVEISSIDGVTLTGYWMHRNLLGGAENLRFDAEIAQIGGAGSGIDYSLRGRFEKPAVYGPDTKFFTEFELASLEEPDYDENVAGLAFGVTRDFTETLEGALALGVRYSRVDDRYTAPPETIRREFLVWRAPAALTWDRRDDELDARDGFYLRLEGEPFYESKLENAGFRLGVDARGYRTVGEQERLVLAGRLQLGSLFGPPADETPPDYLYYSGGGGTVRGQPYESLDADYGDGITFGGRSFVGLSAEVRYGVTDQIGVVAFADAGYIGPEDFIDGSGDWHAGAGLGVRYATPVGPIRADIAGPISGDTGDGVHLYIGIGQAF